VGRESNSHFTVFNTVDTVELQILVQNVQKAVATKRVGTSICPEKKMTRILMSSLIHYKSSM
jgi:hypothetical protein